MFSEIKIPYGHVVVVFSNALMQTWASDKELGEWIGQKAHFLQDVMNRIDPSFTSTITVPTDSTVFLFNPNYFPMYKEFTSDQDYSNISDHSLKSLYSVLGYTWNYFFGEYAQENISPHLPLFDATPIYQGC